MRINFFSTHNLNDLVFNGYVCVRVHVLSVSKTGHVDFLLVVHTYAQNKFSIFSKPILLQFSKPLTLLDSLLLKF